MSRCMMMYIWSSDARNKNCFVWGWNKFHRIDCLEILEGPQKWVWFWSRNDPRGELKIGQSEEAASLVHQGKRNWEAMPGHADFRNTLPELCCASQEVVVATSALEGTRAPFPTRKTTHLSGRERKVLPSFSSSVSLLTNTEAMRQLQLLSTGNVSTPNADVISVDKTRFQSRNGEVECKISQF